MIARRSRRTHHLVAGHDDQAGPKLHDARFEEVKSVARAYVADQVAAAARGEFEGEPWERDVAEGERIRPVAACIEALDALQPSSAFVSHKWYGHEACPADGAEVLCDPNVVMIEFSDALSWPAQKVHPAFSDPAWSTSECVCGAEGFVNPSPR